MYAVQCVVDGNLAPAKQMHRAQDVGGEVCEDQYESMVNVFPDKESDKN